MHVVVMGAGAVGCYFGGVLAQTGYDVTFVGRPAHVEAITRAGLNLETRGRKHIIPAKAAAQAAGLPPADLVLVCVKSADTEAVGLELRPILHPDTALLTLQNGVDNAERLQAVIGQPVIPAVVYVGTEMAGPGHVLHHGRGDLVIGKGPQSDHIATVLRDAGIPTTVSEDIAVALWSKLVTNCAYNAISAIADISYAPMLAVAGAREVVSNAIHECIAVAAAEGVQLPGDLEARIFALAESMPAQKSSTAQDIARGRKTEIDFLNGTVVRKGRALGIPTPTNLALLVAVKLIEAKREIA